MGIKGRARGELGSKDVYGLREACMHKESYATAGMHVGVHANIGEFVWVRWMQVVVDKCGMVEEEVHTVLWVDEHMGVTTSVA